MQLLQAKWDEGKFVCVGLDPVLDKMPHKIWQASPRQSERFYLFCRAIVDATHDLVCCYKPNAAFFMAMGPEGLDVLARVIAYINKVAPDVAVILDAKQGDIDSTNDGYVTFDFTQMGADAVTVHNYLGMEAMAPFLDQLDPADRPQPNKGVIVLCHTSNKGAGEYQDRLVQLTHEEAEAWGLWDGNARPDVIQPLPKIPLYQLVAYHVSREWNRHGNCAVVVGATYPRQLAEVRAIVGDMPILIPGLGHQEGDLEAAIAAGKNSRGQGMIINNSRGVIFAYQKDEQFGEGQFALAARKATLKMHVVINRALKLPLTDAISTAVEERA